MNYFKMDLTEEIDGEWEEWKEKENNSLTDMGLLKGWANEGLLYISQKDYSWMNLL